MKARRASAPLCLRHARVSLRLSFLLESSVRLCPSLSQSRTRVRARAGEDGQVLPSGKIHCASGSSARRGENFSPSARKNTEEYGNILFLEKLYLYYGYAEHFPFVYLGLHYLEVIEKLLVNGKNTVCNDEFHFTALIRADATLISARAFIRRMDVQLQNAITPHEIYSVLNMRKQSRAPSNLDLINSYSTSLPFFFPRGRRTFRNVTWRTVY